MRTFTRRASLVLLLSALAAVALSSRETGRVSADRFMQDIRYLTSPALGGRASGSPGLTKAAEYIAEQFRAAGLRPAGPSATWFQSFPIAVHARKSGPNTLRWKRGGESAQWQVVDDADFEPAAFSASGHARLPVVFAGYGASACEYGYDDYANIDVRGKIVLLMRHEPLEYETTPLFEGRVYSEHSQILRKLLVAKDRGAAAVLLVNDMAAHSGPDTLEKLTPLPSPSPAGVPFAGIRASVVEQWFREAGRDFAETQSKIDRTLEPQSFTFPPDLTVDLQVSVSAETRMVSNVVGYRPGETDEYLIVGAHYDHLGNGEQFSLASLKTATMHPGADDNASGTAATIALARRFGGQKQRRGILFATFAGEEIGLLGSTWLAHYPVLPLERAAAMVNMDMIGRMRERSLIVGGVNTGEGLRDRVEAAGRRFPVELRMGGQAVYGSSDHTAFLSHRIPSLFFFTGLHGDYHRPSDTAEKIDARSATMVADLVGEIVASLASSPSRPRFLQPAGVSPCAGDEKFPHSSLQTGRQVQ